MNSELLKALISQIGTIVGIPLAAVLAVWQAKRGIANKHHDEVCEKSFDLCCALFDIVNPVSEYSADTVKKIVDIVNAKTENRRFLHPEILNKIENIQALEYGIGQPQTPSFMLKKVKKKLKTEYDLLRVYILNENNRLRKALGYPRDTLYSFHKIKYGASGLFMFINRICYFIAIGVGLLIVYMKYFLNGHEVTGNLILLVVVGSVTTIFLGYLTWNTYSPKSVRRFIIEQKRQLLTTKEPRSKQSEQ